MPLAPDPSKPESSLSSQRALADAQVALGERDFNTGFTEFLLDREIEIAVEAAGSMTHFRAPDHQFKMDRTLSKFLQEHIRRWVSQDMGIAFPGRNQGG